MAVIYCHANPLPRRGGRSCVFMSLCRSPQFVISLDVDCSPASIALREVFNRKMIWNAGSEKKRLSQTDLTTLDELMRFDFSPHNNNYDCQQKRKIAYKKRNAVCVAAKSGNGKSRSASNPSIHYQVTLPERVVFSFEIEFRCAVEFRRSYPTTRQTISINISLHA